MKRVWLVVVLVALGGLAGKTFADVQNIRLSGDVRIRGYFLDNMGDPTGTGVQNEGGSSFISQRTRVSVEADLEDHVLVVVTLAAEGLWGSDNSTSDSSGSGTSTSSGSSDKINRSWDAGINEAYVQFNEMFYTPATLKLGRQYLQYGRGLILSNYEQEYNFDAGRLVLDYYPLTIDLVGAELVNNQTFGSTSSQSGSANLLFANARYEMTDSIIKDVELYFGWVSQGSSALVSTTRVPPTFGNASPWIIGARSDLAPVEGLSIWLEGLYEGGANGTFSSGKLEAYMLNAGFRYTLKDVTWSPAVNGNFIMASGGGKSSNGFFRPWFDYMENYNGYIFCPELSNIQIYNLGVTVKPRENLTTSIQGYFYRKMDGDGPAGSNPAYDAGGTAFTTFGTTTSPSQDLGWEIDQIVGYDYSKDVHFQLVHGWFVPLNAYRKASETGTTAEEVRLEVNVKF